ncbi:MAG: LexA family transcriptional regulator [Campylobacteraceae bacterium]|nr:LexA family transcriptional regulator [Campylobacteraceae bacterium]
MENMGKRLKEVRKHLNFTTQSGFSAAMGWRKTRVQDVEAGKVKGLDANEARAITRKFHIDGWWLLTGEGTMVPGEKETDIVYIKNCNSEIGQSLPFPKKIINQFLQKTDRLMYHEATTDTMSPTFNIGDILLFDTNAPKTTDGVFIIEIEGQISCKRLQFLINNEIRVFQDNKNYEPMIIQSSRVKVLGQVVIRFSKL